MNNKILLVDDELDFAELSKLRLEGSGYEVTTVVSGEEALVLLKNYTPDLILLDLLLPGMRGKKERYFMYFRPLGNINQSVLLAPKVSRFQK